MSKGFVFSLDVFFAAMIITFFLATFPSQEYETHYDKLMLLKQAQDTLNVLTPSLQSMNPSTINDSLKELIPPNLNHSLEVLYYNPDNSLNQSINLGDPVTTDFVNARRVFLVTSEGNITLLGKAEMRLWP
ncbi:MAG: hypothetical protein GOU97_04425 [Nanoarchaeota archaeon]|nr:hypothetical protein [Nanoarchaeota archaeon]